jgi:hypothetical protein
MRDRRSLLRLAALGTSSTFLWFGGCMRSTETSDPDGKSPSVRFVITYDRGSRLLQIIHASGETVSATDVFVRGDGLERTGSWSALSRKTPDSTRAPTTVSSGDSLQMGADTDFLLRIVWDRGGESRIFVEESGPDAG